MRKKCLTMSGAQKRIKSLEKEEVLQAVVVVDDFDGIFSGFTREESAALLPIVNVRAVDYALECLGQNGFHECFLFCTTHAKELKEHLKNTRWTHSSTTMLVTTLVSEKCQSIGDVLRDIDNRALIKGDFVLMSVLTVSNLNLINIMKYHKQKYLKDKGTVMTLILQDTGLRYPELNDCSYVVNSTTDKLLMHFKASKAKKFEIPLECLNENANLNIYCNLVDTGITICSPSVPLLFSDNFDFQTKEDFIHGLLINKEILDNRIYCYQVENGYGATIKNWKMYQKVSLDCIHRWTFPLVPDQPFNNGEKPFTYYRNCIYKQNNIHLGDFVQLKTDVVIGANSQIGHNSSVERSVIGKNCSIGQNVVIRDCYLMDNCKVEDNCKIELTVLGENSSLKADSIVRNCFIKKNSLLTTTSQKDESVIAEEFKKNSNESLEDFDLLERYELVDPEVEKFEMLEEEDVSSTSEDDECDIGSPEPDDTTLFYIEVVDSLQRGFEEKLICDNLILEINSSRYAYNVMLSDVSVLTLKAILLLPKRVNSPTKAVLTYFLPLLKNYIKTSEAQMNCLHLLEEIHDELGNELAKCLHFLYDNDIIAEDNILEWHNNLENDSPVLVKIAPLIKWLNEAAEESSTENESS